MLKVHEITSSSGQLSPVFLRVQAGVLELVTGGAALPLPPGALEAVMKRYGAPFDPEAQIARLDQLALAGGATLCHLRHLAGYDVIARDYLLLEAEGAEPLCALATTVAGALQHLARASLEQGQ